MAHQSRTRNMEPTLPGVRQRPEVTLQSFPLSFAQQRLWVLDQLEPDGSTYNVPLSQRLAGPLHAGALEGAFTEVVRRHAVLRTEFHSENGGPVQIVLPAARVPVTVVDLGDIPPAEQEARALRLAIEEARKPFDLSRGPLLRVSLLRLAELDHVLLITAHHIAFDGWSVGILLSELARFYEAALRGESCSLVELPLQYGDFAIWQRKALPGGERQQQLAYWVEQLSGAPSRIDLPTDRPRPPMQTFRGSGQTVVIAQPVLERLQDSSRSQGVTLFVTLLAGFNILLSRYSGQDDLVVGTPIAGRNRPELEQLIGLFVNPLMLRTDVSGDPSVSELLRRVQKTALDAYAHQDMPFELLVEELHTERDMSRNPLFQIVFSLQDAPRDEWQLPGLTVGPFHLDSGTEKFDLSVNLVQKATELRATFGYNTHLFDPATIARMMGHFQKLLEELVANPQRRISELPLLAEAEKRRVLTEFNDTAATFRTGLCIHNFFEAQVERTPDATALVCEDGQLTYAGLNSRANRLAHHLRKRGVGPEVLVGICVERSRDMLVGILGILKAGAAYVPLDPAYPKDRLAAILDDAKAPVLLTQQPLLDILPRHAAEIIRLDADWQSIAAESADNPASNVKAENLGYVLFTSGSTGRPKGVALEHRSAATFMQWAQTVFTSQEVAGTLFSTSMCFDLSVFEMFVPLSMGGKVIMAQNALFLPKLAAANEVTLINTVPSAIAELVRMDGVPASVQVVNLAGEALLTSLAQQIYGKTRVRKVYNLYGPTEDTTYSTYTLVPRGGEVTIGRPLSNTQVYILDANRQPTPIGVPGELHLAGEGLARGYFGRPDLTAERFLPNPFSGEPGTRMYRTGDLARWLPDGNIQYLGRIDNQVKIRGFRIELGEIESVLTKNSSVQSAVVVAREDQPGDKRLVAYVVPAPAREVASAELRRFLKESLPEYMIPAAIVTIPALPLTPNGKINRRALPAPDWSQLERVATVAARDPLEQMLVKIWQNALGIPHIGVTDNFFDLGGHSLLAARLLSEVEKVAGRQLPLSALFRGPTVESLAQLIRQGSESAPEPVLVEIQAGSSGCLPFFGIASPGVETLGFGLLARHMGPDQPVYKLQGHAPIIGDRPFTEPELRSLSQEYIAAMRAVQSEGPYCFGGMCEGVQIGERMVLDLEAQGHEVGLFAIFDTWVLQNVQRPWLWRLAYYRQRLRSLRKLDLAEQVRLYKKALHNNLSTMIKSGKPEVRSDWRQAYWPETFTSRRFRAPIALFKRPKQPFYYVNDPQMGWGARTEGGVEIHEIDFRHQEILREPYVSTLGETLATCVQRVSRRTESERVTIEGSQ